MLPVVAKFALLFILLAGTAWASHAPDHEYPLFDPPPAYDTPRGDLYFFDADKYLDNNNILEIKIGGRKYYILKLQGEIYWYDMLSKEPYRFLPPSRWKKGPLR